MKTCSKFGLLAIALTFSSAASALCEIDGGTTRYIVTLKPGAQRADALTDLTQVGKRNSMALRKQHPMFGNRVLVTFDAGNGGPIAKSILLGELRQSPDIESVTEDLIAKPTYVPNDALLGDQWSLAANNAYAAWDLFGGQPRGGALIAVLDTGYVAHADLNAKIVGGYDLISDPAVSLDGDGRDADARDMGDWQPRGCWGGAQNSSWHGTQVAGIAAASTNNGVGIAGMAPDAQILPVRVLGQGGGYLSDIIDGLAWSAGLTVPGTFKNWNPARIINMSLSGAGYCSTELQATIDAAREFGATVVVAAGNNSSDANFWWPANCENVIVVGAVNQQLQLAPFSNFGNQVDIYAPGTEILVPLNKGTRNPDGIDFYANREGTSQAAPQVAATVAMMQQFLHRPTGEYESILRSTAAGKPQSLNAYAAVALAKNAPTVLDVVVAQWDCITHGSPSSNVVQVSYSISAPAMDPNSNPVYYMLRSTGTWQTSGYFSQLAGSFSPANLKQKFNITLRDSQWNMVSADYDVDFTNVYNACYTQG